ncbi:hypothetical protein BJF79_44150, partial [Actinomadura sp. CNU-125]|uniref:RNA polymerase sigma factor n=1 Tax=Actinomadura sp. CNU-125 TaxID=1904961 RepID=UPI000968B106
MSGWPTFDRADDERSARALAGGDPAALLQVMDRYAARLYDYCHALLRDRDAAAAALHDALVGASAQVSHLREPHLFRAWLYALVRAECLRRLGDPARPVERHEAPEVEDGFLDEEELARRLEARRLVRGALSVLRGREREALDLTLRHGLDIAEIGGVLDMDAPEAAELADAPAPGWTTRSPPLACCATHRTSARTSPASPRRAARGRCRHRPSATWSGTSGRARRAPRTSTGRRRRRGCWACCRSRCCRTTCAAASSHGHRPGHGRRVRRRCRPRRAVRRVGVARPRRPRRRGGRRRGAAGR